MTENTRSVFIKTYGCQMNVYDSERMMDALGEVGFGQVSDPNGADLVILNTCHIREKAAEKVYSELGRLRVLKEERAAEGHRMLLAVAGCVAQAEGEEIVARAPFVDMVFGPQTYHRLPEMVAKADRTSGTPVLDTDFPVEDKFDLLPEERQGGAISQFLTVQEGCDKFCTFCVVPYTRGAEQSRPVERIVAEAERLVRNGTRELTLLGQNVNAFHGEGVDGKEWGLGRLIRRLGEIDGLERIRYTTSHPRDVDDELIAAHRDEPKLMPYLHLPVQSGSDRILAAMNRRHTADDYYRVVDRLRNARPDLALTSDFIVGFPGESDGDFADTLKLVTEIGYAGAFSFKYSRRPGTPASGAMDQVEAHVKDERLAALQQLLSAQQEAFDRSQVGRDLPVLVEKPGRKPGQLVGRSPFLQPVHIDAPESLIGSMVHCRIDEFRSHSLFGHILSSDASADSQPKERACA